jgi:beta-galactosidase
MNQQPPIQVNSIRQRFLFDSQWRFYRGEPEFPPPTNQIDDFPVAHTLPVPGPAGPDYNDCAWSVVDLPHDWAVEGPFDPNANFDHGFLPTGIGWYRKTFTLQEEDQGKRIYLEFEGAYRDSTVWINGFRLGNQPSGYISFHYDISDFVNYNGTNLLSVRLDASQDEGWWYDGAGIYRHVWLFKVSALHVPPWGVFVHSQPDSDLHNWEVDIQTELSNQTDQLVNCTVESTVLDANHVQVAVIQSTHHLVYAEVQEVRQSLQVNQPHLWSPEDPYLYYLQTTLRCGDAVVDICETTFGFRTLRFDAQQGFFLNEKPMKLKGTCNHQDHAGVGVAIPDSLYDFRIRRLKEMGSNAYRCSHNSPAPALLDACDRLGMLVMDETRHLDSSPQGLFELESLVRRDRNHPSVILWSIGNEEYIEITDTGGRIAASMKRLIRRLDPTRLVTQAMLNGWGGLNSEVLDVQGFNYSIPKIDAFHEKFPDKPTLASENGSATGTRGIYADDPQRGYVNAYDHDLLSFSYTAPVKAEVTWMAAADRPFIAGTFYWTGFDYRGEPTPYRWPCINSHFGVMDMCGFPKDTFFYFQSWWSDHPVLHIFPHWNWPGLEGKIIDVWCYSNCGEIELFLNDVSLGRKALPINSHVEWHVPYVPGILAARGFKDNQEVIHSERRTTGAPAAISLQPDRKTIKADGEDVVVIDVAVEDEYGLVVPFANNLVRFSVKGSGKILGVGNGDPSCHEPDKACQRSVFNGLCQVILQASTQPGEILLLAKADSLQHAKVTIKVEEGQIRPKL